MEQFAFDYPRAQRAGSVVVVKPRHLMLGLLGVAAAGAYWLLRS